MKTRHLIHFLLALLLSSHTFAQAYKILSYDVDIALQIDGKVEIHEIITVDFLDSRRGIMRDIPKQINIEGHTAPVRISNIYVRDFNYKLVKNTKNHRIRIGDPDVYLTGTQRYELQYQLNNILIRESDHTAFQYNVVADWDTTIDTLNYNITLPKDLDIRYNNYRIFTGQDGGNEREATIQKEGNNIFGYSLSAIAPEENVTVAIKFPLDYFEFPPPKASLFKRDKLWYLPIGVIILLISFFTKNRRPTVEPSAQSVSYPPENMSPAEIGTFVDGAAHVRDFIALLPYWADKKYIKILGEDKPRHDYILFFKKLNDLPAQYPAYQHIIFNALFDDDAMVSLADLKDKLAKVYFKSSKAIKSELRNRGLYDDDEKALFHSKNILILSILTIASAVLLIIKTAWLLTGIGLIFLALALFVIYLIPVKKSEKGQRLQNQIIALKSFLKDGSGTELNSLLQKDDNYFNKLFPYAIALNIDKSWLNRMEDYDLQSPHWFYTVADKPYPHSQMQHFQKNFNVDQISSVFKTSSTGSSGSFGGSSSSGGGSAGGGFGGGGSSW